PYGYELDITVDFSQASIAEVIRRTRGRLTLGSAYWITCAERHLADYLWETDDYPPDGRITVDCLTPDDLDMASRWGMEVLPEPASLAVRLTTVPTSINAGPANSRSKAQPIKVVTENGYSIVRLSDLDRSVSDTPQECHFQVANPNGVGREIRVRFDEELV